MRGPAVAHPGPSSNLVLYWIGRLWMWIFGWTVDGEPPQVAKAVIIATPHTSNWDLPHMLAASWVLRMKIAWLGKHTLFRPPLGWLLRLLGGMPVDRSAPHGLVQQAADAFADTDALFLAVPPSGTRKKRDHWKSGFYWIAHTAHVPIVAGYLDFSRKQATVRLTIEATGDVEADMDRLRAFYAPVVGKFPEAQTPVLLREELKAKDPPPDA